MRRFRHYFLLAVVTLAGCVSSQRIEGPAPSRSIEALRQWTTEGRIGVTGAEQNGSANFRWQQRDLLSDVQLWGPLGMGSLQMTLNDQRLSMRTSDGGEYNAAAVLDQLQTRLGVAMPVNQLRYWLLGVAAPGEHHWDTGNTVLDQDGWRIEYNQWLPTAALRLPGKLTMTRPPLRVIIVMQHWQLDA